ncbi:hypothetical protein [Thermosphaera sp.]
MQVKVLSYFSPNLKIFNKLFGRLGEHSLSKPGFLAKIVLNLSKHFFHAYAVLWLLKPRRASSMKDVLKLFYIDFLMVDEKDVEVVKLSDNELVTRCRNPCPILKLSQRLRVDTRVSCKIVSEPVCNYVLRKLNRFPS